LAIQHQNFGLDTDFSIPSDMHSDVPITAVRALMAGSSPLKSRHGERNTYMEWVSSERLCRPGIYIWLLPRSGGKYRFLHVGMSTTSVSSRTKDHCCNYFKGDPLPEYDEACGSFGHLRRTCAIGKQPDVEDLVQKVRILYFIIPKGPADRFETASLRALERMIAYAASERMGRDQITNTLGRTMFPRRDCSEALCRAINGIMPIFPEPSRQA
jgi:hypothetical protein